MLAPEERYPDALSVGDVLVAAIDGGVDLVFQVRALEVQHELAWLRVFGAVDDLGDLEAIVEGTEVTCIRFLTDAKSRRAAGCQVVGRCPVPSSSAGSPPVFGPGVQRDPSGALVKGYNLDSSAGRVFVREMSAQQERDYYHQGVRYLDSLAALYAVGWDMYVPV